jgi:hypothetical protein
MSLSLKDTTILQMAAQSRVLLAVVQVGFRHHYLSNECSELCEEVRSGGG